MYVYPTICVSTCTLSLISSQYYPSILYFFRFQSINVSLYISMLQLNLTLVFSFFMT